MKTLNTLFPTRLARRALLAAGLAGAAALVAPMAAQAQEQRRVAIVSALGDSITVVQSEPTTGSHFKDRRVEDVFPVPEGPNRVTISPLSTLKDSPFRTASALKVLCRFLISICVI